MCKFYSQRNLTKKSTVNGNRCWLVDNLFWLWVYDDIYGFEMQIDSSDTSMFTPDPVTWGRALWTLPCWLLPIDGKIMRIPILTNLAKGRSLAKPCSASYYVLLTAFLRIPNLPQTKNTYGYGCKTPLKPIKGMTPDLKTAPLAARVRMTYVNVHESYPMAFVSCVQLYTHSDTCESCLCLSRLVELNCRPLAAALADHRIYELPWNSYHNHNLLMGFALKFGWPCTHHY